LIAPECREEIFGFENGMECRGCPIDICKGQLPIGVSASYVSLVMKSSYWTSNNTTSLDKLFFTGNLQFF
jgi:hypothetical protein